MDFLTVSNLLNALMIVSIWAVKSELSHIRKDINHATETAEKAHGRIDSLMMKAQ